MLIFTPCAPATLAPVRSAVTMAESPPSWAEGATCTDKDVCTSDACTDGSCVGTPLTCDDGNPCTIARDENTRRFLRLLLRIAARRLAVAELHILDADVVTVLD